MEERGREGGGIERISSRDEREGGGGWGGGDRGGVERRGRGSRRNELKKKLERG